MDIRSILGMDKEEDYSVVDKILEQLGDIKLENCIIRKRLEKLEEQAKKENTPILASKKVELLSDPTPKFPNPTPVETPKSAEKKQKWYEPGDDDLDELEPFIPVEKEPEPTEEKNDGKLASILIKEYVNDCERYLGNLESQIIYGADEKGRRQADIFSLVYSVEEACRANDMEAIRQLNDELIHRVETFARKFWQYTEWNRKIIKEMESQIQDLSRKNALLKSENDYLYSVIGRKSKEEKGEEEEGREKEEEAPKESDWESAVKYLKKRIGNGTNQKVIPLWAGFLAKKYNLNEEQKFRLIELGKNYNNEIKFSKGKDLS